MSLAEANSKGFIKTDSLETSSTTPVNSAMTTTRQTLSIKSIVDPATGEELHPTVAVERGVLDLERGLHYNRLTGKSLMLHEAHAAGLVKADAVKEDDQDSSSVVSASASLETCCLVIRAVIDPRSGEHLTEQEAKEGSLLDSLSSRFLDPRSDQSMSISEAIERGHVIAVREDSVAGSTTIIKVIIEGFLLKWFLNFDGIMSRSTRLGLHRKTGLSSICSGTHSIMGIRGIVDGHYNMGRDHSD